MDCCNVLEVGQLAIYTENVMRARSKFMKEFRRYDFPSHLNPTYETIYEVTLGPMPPRTRYLVNVEKGVPDWARQTTALCNACVAAFVKDGSLIKE